MKNRMRLSSKTIGATLFFLMLMSANTSFGFEPFTPVKDVCPKCTDKTLDVITLNNGANVRAKVVGNNPDFYVVYLYGEYRPIAASEIKAVKWNGGEKPASVDRATQLVLHNGKTFSGTIKKENEQPAYFILTLPELSQDIIIFKNQVKKEYRNGKAM